MDVYDWTLSRQATERFITLRASERRELMDAFSLMANSIHKEPELVFDGTTGCQYCVNAVGKYVITYQIDHAVKLINIVAIEN